MITRSTQRTATPMTEDERRAWSDIAWLEDNADLQAKYAGQWVIVHDRAVVASDVDRDACLRKGAEVTMCPPEELTIWPVPEASEIIVDPIDEPNA